MDQSQSKSRDEIVAERETRKAAKLAAKKKAKEGKSKVDDSSLKVNCGIKIPVNNACSVDEMNKELKHMSLQSEKDTGAKMKNVTPVSKPIVKNVNSISDKPQDSDVQSIDDNETKSKSQLRAERRAKQDSQRALKQKMQFSTSEALENPKMTKHAEKRTSTDQKPTKLENKSVLPRRASIHKVKLFSHLYQKSSISIINDFSIHPAIVKLGVQYQSKVIIGANARCVAFLHGLQQVINDYTAPSDKDFSRGLEMNLSTAVSYLDNCRPFSVSMTNALKHLKWHLTQLPNNIADTVAQNKLLEIIDTYIKEQIDMAGKAICIKVQEKISNGDVILTYGFSSLVERILIESYRNGKQFRVIVVDGGPLFEGRELLRRFVKHSLPCTYVLLSAASFIMREASKVLLGAHALLNNGYVKSRAGASQIALIARSCNVPVLVCCETHKFSERVQTDAFVYNELGEPEKVMERELWESNNYLTPLSLMYDVTPSDIVTAVVTELAILPCTSVPVVLRVKPAESALL